MPREEIEASCNALIKEIGLGKAEINAARDLAALNRKTHCLTTA